MWEGAMFQKQSQPKKEKKESFLKKCIGMFCVFLIVILPDGKEKPPKKVVETGEDSPLDEMLPYFLGAALGLVFIGLSVLFTIFIIISNIHL
jgi:hypothetical protein